MRYVCEFAGADDGLLIRDLADTEDELEDILKSGIEHLGLLMRCYSLDPDEEVPILGLLSKKEQSGSERTA